MSVEAGAQASSRSINVYRESVRIAKVLAEKLPAEAYLVGRGIYTAAYAHKIFHVLKDPLRKAALAGSIVGDSVEITGSHGAPAFIPARAVALDGAVSPGFLFDEHPALVACTDCTVRATSTSLEGEGLKGASKYIIEVEGVPGIAGRFMADGSTTAVAVLASWLSGARIVDPVKGTPWTPRKGGAGWRGEVEKLVMLSRDYLNYEAASLIYSENIKGSTPTVIKYRNIQARAMIAAVYETTIAVAAPSRDGEPGFDVVMVSPALIAQVVSRAGGTSALILPVGFTVVRGAEFKADRGLLVNRDPESVGFAADLEWLEKLPSELEALKYEEPDGRPVVVKPEIVKEWVGAVSMLVRPLTILGNTGALGLLTAGESPGQVVDALSEAIEAVAPALSALSAAPSVDLAKHIVNEELYHPEVAPLIGYNVVGLAGAIAHGRAIELFH